jgi:Na+-translocating ferredoxin:NAD+ oxidoreductase RnfD subunit
MAQTTTRPVDTPGPASRPSPNESAGGWIWPAKNDPRWPFAATLTLYAILGCTILGFNRNPLQILLTILTGCLLDTVLAWQVRRQKIVPLSAWISCTSIALLLNYSHNYWMLLFPVLLTVGSKYVLTVNGKHFFNPSMFGVAVSLLTANELITAAPAYQWGGSLAMSAFIVMAALSLFAFKVRKGWLIASFLVFYTLQTALRAWFMRHHLPPETLFLGTLTSAPFFIFTFYMITDPQTSPKTPKGQIAVAFALTLIDLVLHKFESVFTFFYAALILASARFLYMHAKAVIAEGSVMARLRTAWSAPTVRRAYASVGMLTLILTGIYAVLAKPAASRVMAGFTFETIPAAQSGIHSEMGNALKETDPRLHHIAKWLLSVGDAVAVGDFDNDGRQDLFLTNPLKRHSDRNALYRNLGGFRFERVPVPALAATSDDAKTYGLASAAAFADLDGDGDQDLLVNYAFGTSRLLTNQLKETGRPTFIDATKAKGLDDYTISLTANVFDYDRDGKLDLFVGNTLHPYLPGYETPTKLNIFDLPKPAFPGDRRMFDFMHNGWHNADNGGQNVLYKGLGDGTFARQDNVAMGLPETHWTLAVATGDFNQDGWTDLYCASDFGRDDLYLNRQGKGFERQAGRFFGDIGLDTYKGMNATAADFDRNGYPDVYVSNVHHSLQAEGSLMWMTRPTKDAFHPSFSDEATARGILNENRFGWGAAAGDLNNDGWLDVMQANGMVDDRLDPLYEDRKDYWYVNHKLMQAGPDLHTFADKWGDIRGRTIYPNEKRRVYLNQGATDSNQFVDIADQVGLSEGDNSRGVAMVDLDDDGDLDAVITNQHGPVTLLRNTLYGDSGPKADQPGWLALSLEGNGKDTPRLPVGSRLAVHFTENGKPVTHHDEVRVVDGFMSQRDPRIHVGLGKHSGPVSVDVTWYGSGKTVTCAGLQPNRHYRISQAGQPQVVAAPAATGRQP